MKTKINISVCMATYNGSEFIERQLKSILSQLDSTDEVVITDDISTDDTISLIESVNDSRVKIFVNNYKKGPAGNFSESLSKASGEFIFLADQDDIWLSDKVSTCVSILNGYQLVLSDCVVVDNNEKVLYKSFFEMRGSKIGLIRNLYKNSYVGCCMAFRRDLLDYILPIPTDIHMHDWWIGLIAEATSNVYLHNTPLIKYVRHGTNASPTGENGYGLIKKLRIRLNIIWHLIGRLIVKSMQNTKQRLIW